MLPILNSLWLGLLTTITPCVLSANMAIISYVNKKSQNSAYLISSTLFYMLGRILFYWALTVIILTVVDKVDSIVSFLQNELNIILGFILIFVGLVLLNVIDVNFGCLNFIEKIKNRTDKSKYFSSFAFGVLLAGMFCPVTASLFIANLIHYPTIVLSPLVYGFGTGVSALCVAVLLVVSRNRFQKFYKHLNVFEKYSSKITGVIFILMGIMLIFKLF